MTDVPGPVTDERAYALRSRYHDAFGGTELPVPVESIAADLLGLLVEEDEIDCSGLLLPAERRVVVRAGEPAPRQRFTLAHEVGHWVCQVLEGHTAPLYCRDVDVSEAADRQLEREANVFAAELLMPEPTVRAAFAGAVEACAATFGVSGEAMQWRLYNLKLVEGPPTA
jgi:Zn-dependent peptidase ImmA (M78 family)